MTKQEMIEKLVAANMRLTGKEKVKDLKNLLKTLSKEEVKEPKDGQYHLVVEFNNQVFEFNTDDLFASFRTIEKPFLKSKVVVTVEDSEGKKAERSLLGHMARSLFINDTALRILFKRLILK